MCERTQRNPNEQLAAADEDKDSSALNSNKHTTNATPHATSVKILGGFGTCPSATTRIASAPTTHCLNGSHVGPRRTDENHSPSREPASYRLASNRTLELGQLSQLSLAGASAPPTSFVSEGSYTNAYMHECMHQPTPIQLSKWPALSFATVASQEPPKRTARKNL
jgi:hypothetical protein